MCGHVCVSLSFILLVFILKGCVKLWDLNSPKQPLHQLDCLVSPRVLELYLLHFVLCVIKFEIPKYESTLGIM